MYRIFVTLSAIILGNTAFSQVSERSYFGGIVYKTSGIGLAYQNKVSPEIGKGRQLDIEIATHHHPQETKTFNSDINNPTPYVFGKLNKVAILKFQYSITHKISSFSDAQRVGIDLIYGGGLSIGILKPVYLNLIYPNTLGYESIVAEKYNPDQHLDKSRIAGYADNRVGLNELDFKTGISASAGIGFMWGYFTNFPKRLETGFFAEYFNKGLPVMAFAKNKSFKNGFYIKIFIGKRVTKN